jgi:hypothetical protein
LDTIAGGEGEGASVALRLLENLIWHTLFWNFMVAQGLYSKKERRERHFPAEVSPRDLALVDWRRVFQTPQPRFRSNLELDGVWRYSSDVSLDGSSVTGLDLNVTAWREVKLPNLANDRGWFRTSFPLPTDWQGRNLLLQVGTGGEGEVWFNGQRVGAYVGSSRLIQLPEAFFGRRDNVLAIRSVGGSPNALSLLTASPVLIAEAVAAADLNNSEVGVDVTLRNTLPKDADGIIEAVCQPITKPGPASIAEKLAFHIPAGKEASLHLLVPLSAPLTWMPEHPNLYNLTITIHPEQGAEDEVCLTFGMRTFEAKGGDFFLNGQRRFPRGVVEIDTLVEQGWEAKARNIQMAKFLGADFIRSSVPDEHLATLCDFLGIMLVEGIGEMGQLHPRNLKIIGEENGVLLPGWQRKVAGIVREEFIRRNEMVVRHRLRGLRQHPSVVMWEFSREVPAYLGEIWGKVYPRLLEAVRELDPSGRPVVASSGTSPCDEGLRHFDVGWKMTDSEAARSFFQDNKEATFTSHIYCGWYCDRIQTVYNLPTTPPERTFGIREFGAESLPDFSTLDISSKNYDLSNVGEFSIIKYWTGVHSTLEDYRERSQEYQAVLLRTFLDHFRSLKPQIDDFTVFTWLDGAGQYKGLLDAAGRPKKAFWEVKEAFAPLTIAVRWEEKVAFAGETVSFPVTVINDHNNAFFAALRWEIQGVDGGVFARGREELRVEGDSVQSPKAVTWEVPLSIRGGFYYIHATLESQAGQALCTRELEFQVVPRGIPQAASKEG